jgi:hypothetical protein
VAGTHRDGVSAGRRSRRRMSLTCDELKAHMAEVLVEWHAIAGEQPWLSMPAERGALAERPEAG